MELIIAGYGRMGREIHTVAGERGHRVLATVDPVAPDATYPSVQEAVDHIQRNGAGAEATVIDFSLPSAVAATVHQCCRAGWPLVIGTTGWDTQRDALLEEAAQAHLPVIWGANFSVGANLFVHLAAYAQQLAERAGGYDSAIIELHHRGKKDSPSGTALMTARHMLAHQQQKDRIQQETLHRAIEENELHVVAARVGSVPGTHTVYLDSIADTVELTHRARTRTGFALGAVRAAEWLQDHRGIHTVEEFFRELYGDSQEQHEGAE